jgi:hypothetical protein
MDFLYVAWALLALVFVAAFVLIKAKEGKAAKRLESAIDPMFRPGRNGRSAGRAHKPSP